MKASVHLLNRYLEPGDVSTDQAERLLTNAGLPIDSREPLPGGDARLEVEVTSNRGDCLSHIGLAREIAATSSRTLKLPVVPPISRSSGDRCSDHLSLENQAPTSCPRFTVHVIRNCTIGPSPAWLRDALEAVGQRSINNVVDITNFLNFEFGQPCHAFDLAKLAGRTLIVRTARDNEPLTTLDGKKRTLKPDQIVVADGQRAQSLAGVIGGADSEVSAATRDIVLEVATWDPVAIRRAARHHQIKTDASHRFERIVDPRTIELPARRAAALIAELAKGALCAGMLDAGPAASSPAPLREIPLRPARCRQLLGIDIPDAEIAAILQRLEIQVEPQTAGAPPTLLCTIPPFRPDLEREVDLIEEVARIKGFDAIPVHDRVTVQIRPPQASESAAVELGSVLTGLGFYETVTFSFIPPKHATPFLSWSLAALSVADDRRAADGTLRPSILPSLLACRRKNQDGGVDVPGGIRLFETAAAFSEPKNERKAHDLVNASHRPSLERQTLALLMDVPGVTKGKAGSTEQRQHAIRILRGAVESVVHALAGPSVQPVSDPSDEPFIPAFDPAASARILANRQFIGWLGLIAPDTQRLFDLDIPVAAAEIELAPLLALYPPRSRVHSLPAFPAIQRDLSLVLDESTPWSAIDTLTRAPGLDKLEDVSFVGTYRGKPLPAGKKSVTLRLTFRDAARTLRHDEVDPQVSTLIARARSDLRAEIRA
jgi:phenylalanyl-tRNA synthetase beta chain